MHVTIEINGRQALPVRAIPLLTDWRGLSPDQLAEILAGDSDHWPSFDGLSAHRLHADGSTEPVPPRWWASWVVRKLQAIKAKQTSHETGYQQWRRESLAQLPAGVFVWRDEFEAAHADEYGPEGMRARGNPEGFDPAPHALDFNPQPDPAIAPPSLVLEGFGQNLHQEYHDAFAQWCEVDAIDRQVRELETTQPVGVTEILARRAGLKELHVERARLLAVLDDKEPPAPPPTPTPVEPPLNEAPTPATAPVEPPLSATGADAQGVVMKRKALVAALEHEWPTIEADLREASRNGLKDAAATGVHGDWYVEKTRAWALQKGKLKQAAPAHPLASAWAGAVTRNRL